MVRIGVLSGAHLHFVSYQQCLKNRPGEAEIVALWDDDAERGQKAAEQYGLRFEPDLDVLLGQIDAALIASENNGHVGLIERAAARGLPMLCEKPLVTTEADAQRVEAAVNAAGVQLMIAFPCRYSPAFARLRERVANGDIGAIRAIVATNRGTCPFGWFVEPEKSGGGAMIDHVVHVADLLRALLGEEVVRVQAQIGSNMYGEDWDDTAMLTLEFGSGIFATLDSSWSRPPTYKTWGDVTMEVVGDKGTIELDMFGQEIQHYRSGGNTHGVAGYGSNLDQGLIDDFVRSVANRKPVPITMRDGLQAARVAIAGYESVRRGEPVSLA